jgi:asparagine synthase (glutamine-hydrolysing)
LSGICGICEPGHDLLSSSLEPMLSALVVTSGERTEATVGRSIALGVAQRWTGQEVAAIAGIQIAIDADLYNVKELNARLVERGVDPGALKLAECLARLYEVDGPDFLNQLHGIFSIALWDPRKQRLLLAIDRLGAKGLYWGREGESLLFATRLSALCAVRKAPSEVAPAAVTQYLLFSAIPHPMTIYRGVEKLPPATRLIYENGQVRQDRYWDIQYIESSDKDETNWARQVQGGMRSAVYTHLDGCSSENIGAYLSGGTDSSSVVAFMDERCHPVNTFSIFFGEADYSEARFARIAAAHFQTRHSEKRVDSNDALAAIPKIAQFYDEPFANSSSFGAYYCAVLAKEAGIDTLLAGDGGDELFAGNSRYADDKKFALYHSVPSWLRHGLIEPLAHLLPADSGYVSLPRKYIRRASLPNPLRMMSYNFFFNTDSQMVFEPDFLAQTGPESWMDVATVS